MNAVEQYARILIGLHAKFSPHPGQVPIGRALFNDNVKDIFVQAGRNFGKTRLISYLLWRYAQMNPGTENYYFAPYMKQAREIVWEPRIMQDVGPREWIDPPHESQMRIRFKNGSFIKCEGSDNIESYRGVKPRGLVVLDEFKDFRPEFLGIFDPNRAAFDSPMIIIGTPPGRICQFSQVRDEYKRDSTKRYFHGPTSTNPYIKKEWLAKKKQELERRGELDEWQREYEAIEVYGGSSKIFPMLQPKIILPHDELMQRILRDAKRLEWIWWADPGTASVFGILYAAHNPYTKEVFLLDEIYETEQLKMTVKQIGQRAIAGKAELCERAEWRQGYDEAATWFQNEMLDNFGEHLEPSQKSSSDKQTGLTLIKDMLLSGKLIFSDRCIKMYWELDNCFKDKSGNIPKKDDHLIDCLRYILQALYYSLPETKEKEAEETFNGRKIKIGDDFPNFAGMDDKLI